MDWRSGGDLNEKVMVKLENLVGEDDLCIMMMVLVDHHHHAHGHIPYSKSTKISRAG